MSNLVDRDAERERGFIVAFILALAIGFVVVAGDAIERPVPARAEAGDHAR